MRSASILLVLWLFTLGISALGSNPDLKPTKPVLKPFDYPNISTPVIEKKEAKEGFSPILKIRVVSPESNRAFAREKINSWGWDTKQFECLVHLWERESNWNHEAKNPKSSAYGIPQALPAKKMSEISDDWQTNPETQIKWGLKYIHERYSEPCNAWNHFKKKHWY